MFDRVICEVQDIVYAAVLLGIVAAIGSFIAWLGGFDHDRTARLFVIMVASSYALTRAEYGRRLRKLEARRQ